MIWVYKLHTYSKYTNILYLVATKLGKHLASAYGAHRAYRAYISYGANIAYRSYRAYWAYWAY